MQCVGGKVTSIRREKRDKATKRHADRHRLTAMKERERERKREKKENERRQKKKEIIERTEPDHLLFQEVIHLGKAMYHRCKCSPIKP